MPIFTRTIGFLRMLRTSTKIISIYLFIGILWILISDRSFEYFDIGDNSIEFQTLKGIVFIVFSGLIFWYMLKKYEANNEKYLNRLKNITEDLRHSNDRYTVVTKATNNIIWDFDFKKNRVLWGEALTRLMGYEQRVNHSNWWSEKIHPEDRERVSTKFDQFIKDAKKEIWSDEYRIVTESGEIKYMFDRGYLLFNKKGKPIRMIGSMEDISDRKKYENHLKELNFQINKRVEELAITNAELEQFAYVASHDLQEPLRMVTRFLSEIERKYNDQLDDKGREYIHFAVDGAQRMRVLILDLLEYSKAGKFNQKPEAIDMNSLLSEIAHFKDLGLENSNVTLSWKNLPIIHSLKTPLLLVFQNLIGNAIKYQKSKEVQIEITCRELDTFWEFCVSDNGIGINPLFFDKIFVIFQRLHPRTAYSGTGLGLAISKKIIEAQGGRIWVTSEENKGSQFYFTVRK